MFTTILWLLQKPTFGKMGKKIPKIIFRKCNRIVVLTLESNSSVKSDYNVNVQCSESMQAEGSPSTIINK